MCETCANKEEEEEEFLLWSLPVLEIYQRSEFSSSVPEDNIKAIYSHHSPADA